MADELKRNLQLIPRKDGSFTVKVEPGDAEAIGPLLQPNKLLKLGAVLEMTGLSRSRVYDLFPKGMFPAPIKEGRCNLWSSHAVQAWVDAKLKASST